jgi:uncharacterized protein
MRSMKSKASKNHDLPALSDGHTRVIPNPSAGISLRNPILLAGFPDSGMIGSVTINHLIEQLDMHQIASVESEYVMPAAIFIGKRFRHPFRIYANGSGEVCALICEVPVIARGTHSIINTVVEWCATAGQVREIVVLGGILPTNFSPPYLRNRKALVLRNEQPPDRAGRNSGGDIGGMSVPDDAVIVGLAGSLLSTCAARGIRCTGLMIPTVSEAPDPEGAAIILESLPKLAAGLRTDTSLLRQKAELIKKHLEEFLRMHQQQMRDDERGSSRETGGMYK